MSASPAPLAAGAAAPLALSVLAGTAAAAPYAFGAPGGAGQTYATAVNNAGQVAGYFGSEAAGFRGFVKTAGGIAAFGVLGAYDTFAQGINGAGQVVGFHQDATGTHGFVATPTAVGDPAAVPEPASAAVLGAGLAAGRRRGAT